MTSIKKINGRRPTLRNPNHGTGKGKNTGGVAAGTVPRPPQTGRSTVPYTPNPDLDSLGLSGTVDVGWKSTNGNTSLIDALTDATSSGSQHGYGAILEALNGVSNTGILQLLSSLSAQENRGLNQGQATDYNKQLLDMYLAQILENEKRSYNEGLRDEQRVFDSPTNQLARLTGAGISRDAAIQLLSGQGTAPLQTDGANEVTAPAPSETNANRAGAIANAISSGVSVIGALSGLVSAGLAVPAAIQQIKYMKGQNLLMKRDLDAFQSAGDAYAALSSMDAPKEAYGSIATALKYIEQGAAAGNVLCQQFVAKRKGDFMKANPTLSSKRLVETYKSEREAADFDAMYMANLRRANADATVAELNIDAMSQEILNKGEEYNNLLASTDYIKSQTTACNKIAKVYENQAALLEKQGLHEAAQTRLATAQAIKQENENTVTQGVLQGDIAVEGMFGQIEHMTGAQALSRKQLYELCRDVRLAAKQTSKSYVEACFMEMFNSKEKIAYAMQLDALMKKASIDYFNSHPNEAALWSALNDLGFYPWVESEVLQDQNQRGAAGFIFDHMPTPFKAK